MIKTFLVVGGSAALREAFIANTLAASSLSDSSTRIAVLLEGLPDGKSTLVPGKNILISRIAPGCVCCSNNMIMRVYLNRLIQQKPKQIFLSLANGTHLDRIKAFLTGSDYQNILELAVELLPT